MIDREAARIIYQSGEEVTVSCLCAQVEQIRSFYQTISQLEKHIHSLEARLAQTSRNSSKPPSSDGFHKPCPKSLKPKTNRKSGGQKGHPGHTLRMVDDPDERVVHTLENCGRCGSALKNAPILDTEKRQVFDLPPIRAHVTEHQVHTKRCPRCNHRNEAEFPKDVRSPVQYGNRVRSIIIYLKTYQLLPFKRTTLLFRDLFGIALSEGTLANTTESGSERTTEALTQISEEIIRSSVAHFDETGCRVKGKLNWLHVASTAKWTYYGMHPRRGRVAMDAIGILPEFKGRAVHDAFVSYDQYKVKHALCNAHHLRELTYVHEVESQEWARNMKDLLIDIKESVEVTKRAGAHYLPEDQAQLFENNYQLLLDVGYGHNPLGERIDKHKRGCMKKTKARNLIERLDKRRHDALAFMHDFQVPFDNNLAERDIRMMKIQQKISGTFRSDGGAEDFCRIRSYISSAMKNSVGVMDAISGLLADKPYLLGTARSPAMVGTK